METTLNRLISMNIELEGLLRVAANRQSQQALEAAKEKFESMYTLFHELTPQPTAAPDELTQVKYDEAENGELAPNPEPSETEIPAGGEIIESDSDAVADAAHLKADETPAPRKNRGDLRSMLTLNDKFLFKRELFNGSDAEMSDTFELISSMDSAAEAREYLLHDLQWNDADAAVADFLNIVDSYFKS
ncbi:MAG: hypothetical protein K2M61_04255 [Muribaculaceae bacterium]|nr:hypothetical protein [Muribaculaceae bacterium]